MKRITTNLCIGLLLVFSLACNEPEATSEKKDADTVVAENKTAEMPPYDPALDPLTVAGSNGKLLHDSLGIKMFEVTVKPGEVAALHTHPDHAIYILEGGKAMVYSKDFPGGEKGIVMELKAGAGWVGGPLTDSARNIGNTTIRMLEVDVRRPRTN